MYNVLSDQPFPVVLNQFSTSNEMVNGQRIRDCRVFVAVIGTCTGNTSRLSFERGLARRHKKHILFVCKEGAQLPEELYDVSEDICLDSSSENYSDELLKHVREKQQ